MDESKSIRDFELILQNQTCKKPSSLYNNTVNTKKNTYKPQDVVQTVYSQIKAMQMADTRTMKSYKNTKKSNFLCVDKMPKYTPPNPNKFETQCVSDTQLINLLEGVEAIDTNTGVTQEFDTTFAHKVCDTVGDTDNEVLSQILPCKANNCTTKEFDTTFNENVCDKVDEVMSQILPCNVSINVTKEFDTTFANDKVSNTFSDAENEIISQILPCKANICTTKEFDTTFANEKVGEIKNKVLTQVLQSNAKVGVKADFNTFANDIDKNCETMDINLVTEKVNASVSQVLNNKLDTQDVVKEVTQKLDTSSANRKVCDTEICKIEEKTVIVHENTNTRVTQELYTKAYGKTNAAEKYLKSQILHRKVVHKDSNVEDLSNFEDCDNDIVKSQILLSKTYKRKDKIEEDDKCQVTTGKEQKEMNKQTYTQTTEDFISIQCIEEQGIEMDKVTDLISYQDNNNVKEQTKESKDEIQATSTQENDEIITLIKQHSSTTSSSNESTSILANTNIKTITPNSQDLFKIEGENVDDNGFEEEGFNIVNNTEIQIPTSPVLNISRRTKGLSPLIVPLETFEQFENIAVPIIQHNLDLTATRQIINSQIIGKELVLNANFDTERNDSPILELKSDELKVNSEDMNKQINNNNNAIPREKVERNSGNILKDEILFSSDEETETHNKIQDLPLTLALNHLDNSLEDLFDEPDDTMFVGFQTASNKSIQICTNSFEKAKKILEDNEKKKIFDKEFSLTELVEKYDNVETSKNTIDPQANYIVNSNELKSNFNVAVENTRNADVKKNITSEDVKSKSNFEGFTTASNKKIRLSDKAIERCKNIFKDIDLNENFGSENGEKVHDKKNILIEKDKKDQEIIEENFDDLLIQELDNIEKSLEEEKACLNTSLEKNIALDKTDEMQKHKQEVSLKKSAKKICNMSPKALAKTENVLQDIDFEICLEDYNEKSRKIEEKTKSNQQSTSTSPARFKTKSSRLMKIFENVQKNEEEVTVKETKFKEFKMSNNLPTSKQKTKEIFKEIDLNTDNFNHNENIKLHQYENNMKMSTDFVGFKTANNKVIKISKAALSKTKDVFKDLDKVSPKGKKDIEKTNFENKYEKDHIDLATKNNAETPTKYEPSSFRGFMTASNKNVKISEQALLKSKELFKDIDNIEVKPKSNSLSEKLHENVPYGIDNKAEKPFMGFQTASKKPVKVSKDAFAKSRKVFENIDKGIENTINDNPVLDSFNVVSNKQAVSEEPSTKIKEVLEEGIANSNFIGFKTANNKKVNISEAALAKSKRIFENIDLEANNNLNDTNLDKPESVFKGFQTASNKNVRISKDALAKSKKIFENMDLEDNNADNFNISSAKDVFRGFQTANNRCVAISEDALAKSKKIFENIDFDDKIADNFNISSAKDGFRGFQTANNRNVAISEDALAKSKKIFENIDLEPITEEKNAKFVKPKNVFEGFHTASNQKVKISKEAIIKTKNLFDDIALLNEGNIQIKKTDTAQITKTKFENANTNTDITKDAASKIDEDNIINTQVLNNFETSLYTEDFHEKPREILNKRSGSPILSCPRAKRRKFETPYSTQTKIHTNFDKTDENERKNVNLITFTENYKKDKKYTLKDLHFEKDLSKIDPYIKNFNLDNILYFQFAKERNDFIKTEENVTIDEIKKSFTDAINKKLMPNGWLDNHLKLILWKLLSYEINFPSMGKVCTVKNVIDQLKYRYDKELYNAERPMLRKILEKDDVSTNCIVFCVAGIFVDGISVISVTNQTNIELLLTDGWYFVKATIDKMLSKLVYDKKITVGCKIITEGAELLNCEQGISPWEDTSSVRLSITGNSTRPAPWDTKLGLRPVRLRSTLASVKPEGGRIRRLETLVTRLYPLLYVEKLEDGSTVTRSERLEHLYQTKYETEREAMIEKIYEEVGKEFEQDSQDSEDSSGSHKRKAYESGSQIAKMMKKSIDPMEFRAQLSTTQIQNLQEHTNKLRDKFIQKVQDRVRTLSTRQYVTLARVRIVGLERSGENVTITKGMLSVWKPNDAVLDLLKEGNWIEVLNVVPTGIRNSEIQISAGRQSIFRKIKKEDKIFEPYIQTFKRTCHTIESISQNPNMATEYNEIDTVGFIFSIEPTNREFESDKTLFQNVYLSDPDKNIVSVNFWGGIKKFGFENVLDTGQVIFCGNLQKRSGNPRRNVPQYRATEFSVFTKSPKNEKGRALVEEFNKKLFGLDRRRFCEDCVAIKQNYSVLKCFDSENVSPYRFHNNSAYNLGKHKMLIETPKNVKKDEFDLNGLDFESTFKQPETQELSPKTLLRKKQVKEKIARLKMYGEPPPLSPINIINISKNATNSYKSPLQNSESVATANKSVASAELNVATPTKTPNVNANNSYGSPIISIKRTCVKRVNPVKLNFGNVAIEENESTDHFAEEFDGSPPLSFE